MSEEITFSNQDIKFAGTLYKAETTRPSPAVVAVHPASGAKRADPFYEHLRTELPQQGIAVLLFDRRGSGGSGGDFDTADFEDLAGDVVCAAEYLQTRAEIDGSRIGLHGTSQGGWIAPIAAARKPDIAAVVAVSGSGVSPADQMDYGVTFHLEKAGYAPEDVRQAIRLRRLVNDYFRGDGSYAEVAAELKRFEGESWFQGSYLYSGEELPADIRGDKWHYEMDYEPLSVWLNVRQPTLFLFAETDEWVPVEESMRRYREATTHLDDVRFEQIPGTDHLMYDSSGEISQRYLDVLVDWLLPRLGPGPAE